MTLSSSSSDAASTPARRQPKPSERWQAARKVMFGAVKTTADASRPSRKRKSQRLEVFIEAVKHAAMKGDTHAVRQIERMRRHMDRNDILDDPLEISPAKSDMRARIAEHAGVSEIATRDYSVAWAIEDHQLRADHLHRHGTPLVSTTSPPPWLDQKICERFSAIILKNRARKARALNAQEPAVGYRSPPVGTRWAANQSGNPTGRRKRVDDGWSAFRESLGTCVIGRVSGRRTVLSPDEVIVMRLVEKACQGDRPARRLICDLLIELDRRNMLDPPPPRRRRQKLSAEMQHWRSRADGVVLRLMRLEVRKSREQDYATVYGPDPAFQANNEREGIALRDQLRQILAEKPVA